MEKTRGYGYRLHQERFHLDLRRTFFTARTVCHWNDLPRDVLESPLLESSRM